MTPEERKAAAAVMASDGPWDSLSMLIKSPIWKRIDGNPCWDWSTYKFRVRPQPIVRYVNIYKDHDITRWLSQTRADADARQIPERIACVRIEFTPGQFDE